MANKDDKKQNVPV